VYDIYVVGEGSVSLVPDVVERLLDIGETPSFLSTTNSRVIEKNYPERTICIVLYEKKEAVLPLIATVFGFVIVFEAMPWRNDALHVMMMPAGGLASTRGKPQNPMSSYKKFVAARKRIVDGFFGFIKQECDGRGLQVYTSAQMQNIGRRAHQAGFNPFEGGGSG
jgi:hypothetical protein